MEFKKKYLNKTPLFEAVANRNFEIIKLLLMDDKIDVNIANKYTYNVRENKEYMSHLSEYGLDDLQGYGDEKLNDIVVTNITVLYYAIFKEDIELVKLLLSNKITDVNSINKSCFSCASYPDCCEGSACIKSEYTPLYLAIKKKNIEIIKLLLMDDRIDVNLVNKDINYGADGADVGITQEDFTPLCLAVFCKDNEIVKLLLMNKKIDVNILCTFQDVVTNSGFDNKKVLTPLHYAIEEQNVEIVKLLLNNEKININVIGSIGYIENFFKINNLYHYDVNNFTTYFKDFEDKMVMTDFTPLEYAKHYSYSKEIINLLSQKVTK